MMTGVRNRLLSGALATLLVWPVMATTFPGFTLQDPVELSRS